MSHHDHDDDVVTNTSDNPHISDILQARLSRRSVIGGISAASAAMVSSGLLTACDSSSDAVTLPAAASVPTAAKPNFTAVAKNLLDQVTVPPGYTVNVLYSLGDPIAAGIDDWKNDGSETGDSYAQRAGDHHDGMYYFGLSATGTPEFGANDRGILCMNHEALTTTYLHATGETRVSGKRTVADECIKEMNAHGVSVIEIAKTAGKFGVVKGAFNRRITTFTEMELSGPVRGSPQVVTKFSTNGTKTRGTVNNCANGYTPWGTYLTCEENWAGYFARDSGDDAKRPAKDKVSLTRYGNAVNPTATPPVSTAGRHLWETAGADDIYARWITGVTGDSAAADFRNAINTYGFVVEIDPYNPAATPKKRTALGRFAHEGCWPAKAVVGKPLVWYMGDDNRGDYVYKFVSTENWDAADANAADRMAAGDKYMDSGKLYVAKFSSSGTGSWVELKHGNTGLKTDSTPYAFADQADVCLNSRLAGDAVGATKMDRPEWGAVHPITGEVYLTLTNNSNRGISSSQPVDAANPRNYEDFKGSTSQKGNVNGHIIRWRENGDNPAATSFTWDIFLFGAQAGADPESVNITGLTADNDLSSPDGLWFSRSTNAGNGLLWIQTDDGAYTDTTNCMMLVASPGFVGDGARYPVSSATTTVDTFAGGTLSTAQLRRFLVGPKDCEITGIDSTPDGKTLFVNIQHPGETGNRTVPFLSTWPAGGTDNRPRSSTIVITKDDGGVVGI